MRSVGSRRLPAYARRLGAVAVLCGVTGAAARVSEYEWDIPAPFPKPPVPAENPMSAVKVELGRRLFYDNRMSVTGDRSCASCHQQEYAFADARARAVGATGELHPRGSMSLANVAYLPALTWANPTVTSLEDQALIPMLGTDPIELGLKGREAEFIAQLRGDTIYRRLFPGAFPDAGDPYTLRNVVRAIASFERTIISVRSPYDRYRYGGDTTAISDAAKRGERFFFSGQRGSCFQCHGGWNFSGAVRFDGDTSARPAFFNTGLYNIAGETSYPSPNTGLHRITARAEDVGKFRPPTLRNVAVTAPYMHDGTIATLDGVLDHYSAGGRTIADGPLAGVGHDNPNKAPNVHGFAITDAEKRDVIAFLESLTDTAFLHNPALSNPWTRSEKTAGARR
jgi:cytochrome c peroxidase